MGKVIDAYRNWQRTLIHAEKVGAQEMLCGKKRWDLDYDKELYYAAIGQATPLYITCWKCRALFLQRQP